MPTVGGPSSISTQEQIGASGLGGAVFSLYTDTSNFDLPLARAEGNARRFSKTISNELATGSASGSRALLMLGQTIDDAQYGFRSIVNNIPTLVTALGGGAGLAGAIGIAAVAINQAINHWDELKASFQNTAPIEIAVGALQSLTDHLESYGKAGSLQKRRDRGDGGRAESAVALSKGIAAKTEKAAEIKKKIEGMMSEEEEARAKLFAETLKEYGPKKLLKEMVDEQMKVTGGQGRDAVEKRMLLMIGKGLAGEDLKMGKNLPTTAFGENFEKLMDLRGFQDANKGKNEEQERISREFAESAHRKKMEALEDQAHNLEVRREQLQEAIHNRPHFERFEGTKAMVDAMQSKTLNDVPKAQLNELKGINVGIKALHEEMIKERRNFARFS